jgi:hypothetical protein
MRKYSLPDSDPYPTTATQWPYSDELEILELKGSSRVNETVFFHKSTRTLITTDACFNLLNPKGWGAPFIYRVFDNYKKFSVSKLFLLAHRDKKLLSQSFQKMMAWDFDKIVMAHGEIIEGGGKSLFEKSLQARKLL